MKKILFFSSAPIYRKKNADLRTKPLAFLSQLRNVSTCPPLYAKKYLKPRAVTIRFKNALLSPWRSAKSIETKGHDKSALNLQKPLSLAWNVILFSTTKNHWCQLIQPTSILLSVTKNHWCQLIQLTSILLLGLKTLITMINGLKLLYLTMIPPLAKKIFLISPNVILFWFTLTITFRFNKYWLLHRILCNERIFVQASLELKLWKCNQLCVWVSPIKVRVWSRYSIKVSSLETGSFGPIFSTLKASLAIIGCVAALFIWFPWIKFLDIFRLIFISSMDFQFLKDVLVSKHVLSKLFCSM